MVLALTGNHRKASNNTPHQPPTQLKTPLTTSPKPLYPSNHTPSPLTHPTKPTHPHSATHNKQQNMGSVVLPHLVTGWHVDQAIMSEEERLVVIRFGRDWDADCMRQDEVLYRIADRVKNFAVLYVCDLDQVPDFKQMYELYDPVTLMFFFRNKHMVCIYSWRWRLSFPLLHSPLLPSPSPPN